MATFALGDCVRIGQGADPSLVGMEGTWQGIPWSLLEDLEDQPLSELISLFRVALPDGSEVVVEAAFVEPCPPEDDLVAS